MPGTGTQERQERQESMLLLSKGDVRALLSLPDCITAVERAFAEHARGQIDSGVLGMHLPGGGFHLKIAAGKGELPLFVAKLNGNFSGNDTIGLPRIQGLIMLCDARSGSPLAVMDSTEITALRTAAATGVAAKHLAREDASVLTIVGCGRQSRLQVAAVAAVRRLTRILAYDTDRSRAEGFARDVGGTVLTSIGEGTLASDIVITCTPSSRAILFAGDVRPGTFIAAVGADSDTKQEIDPALMAASAVVPDLTGQAAAMGDLHHAIAAGLMRPDQVRAELGTVCAGLATGRLSDSETVVFDSTGTALQDLAAAAIVYQRAVARRRGLTVDPLGDRPARLNPAGPLARILI